jgi:hypothetical protein
MEHKPKDRRLETRCPIEAKVIVRKNTGEIIPATAANISGGGMSLHVRQPSSLSVGEAVAVDVELPDDPGRPFASWGLATVVQCDGCHFGLQLCAAIFDPGFEPGEERAPEL